MANTVKSEAKSAAPDPRGKIVDALMTLAAQQRFEDISIRDICKAAGVSLADFRDCFPSKGAVLAGFSRRIDRAVLAQVGPGTRRREPARAPVRHPDAAPRSHDALSRGRARSGGVAPA